MDFLSSIIYGSSYNLIQSNSLQCNVESNSYIPLNIAMGYGSIVNGYYDRCDAIVRLDRPYKVFTKIPDILNKGSYSVFGGNRGRRVFTRDGVNLYTVDFGYLHYITVGNIDINPLLYLCIKSSEFKDFMSIIEKMDKLGGETVDLNREIYPKLTLLVSSELYEERHTAIMKKIVSQYFPELISQGVDILITKDILPLCYKEDPVKLPKFKNVTEMIAYFKGLNDEIYEYPQPEEEPPISEPEARPAEQLSEEDFPF